MLIEHIRLPSELSERNSLLPHHFMITLNIKDMSGKTLDTIAREAVPPVDAVLLLDRQTRRVTEQQWQCYSANSPEEVVGLITDEMTD